MRFMKKVSEKIEIVQKDNPILRKVSALVPAANIKSDEIKNVISDLKKAVLFQADAVAISAIQIAKPVRLFLISKRAFDIVEGDIEKRTKSEDIVFINPKILKTSKNKQFLEEGCLSVRYVYGQVNRPQKVTVEALDENGKKFSRGFSGLLAQIVQHECDHLDGVLFIDKAKNLTEVSHEDYERSLKDMSKN